jgi:Tol biopolymer transport system component
MRRRLEYLPATSMRFLTLLARWSPVMTAGCGLLVAVDDPRPLTTNAGGMGGGTSLTTSGAVGGSGPMSDGSAGQGGGDAGDWRDELDIDAADPVGMLSRLTMPNSDAGIGRSDSATVSSDGRFVMFASQAQVFLHDRQAPTTTTLVSVVVGTRTPLDGFNYQPSIARDGKTFVFTSDAPSLVNMLPRSVIRQTLPTGDAQRMTAGPKPSYLPVVSDVMTGGATVAFVTDSSIFPDDQNMKNDVFVTWGAMGSTERISVGRDGDASDGSDAPSISADADVVAFESYATNLVPGDTNAARDVFVRVRSSKMTVRASVGNDASYEASLSADGLRVAFTSKATNLVADDRNGVSDIFVYDRPTGQTWRVSVGPRGAEANGASSQASLDEKGRLVAFLSYATNLDPHDVRPPDPPPGQHLFVHDLVTHKTTHISAAVGDASILHAPESRPAISSNGRVVVFSSDLHLVMGTPVNEAGGTIDRVDVFAYEFSSAPWL